MTGDVGFWGLAASLILVAIAMGLSAFSTNIKFHLGHNYIQTFIRELGDFFSDLDHYYRSYKMYYSEKPTA